MADMQKDIAEFFNGLTPKEQEEWWEEGDFALDTHGVTRIVTNSISIGLDSHRINTRQCFYSKCIPSDCPQFWWKLMVKHIGICKALENLNEAPIISYSGPEGTAHYHDDEEATKTKRVLLRAAINMQNKK